MCSSRPVLQALTASLALAACATGRVIAGDPWSRPVNLGSTVNGPAHREKLAGSE